jgi:hypothetical protein
LLVLWGAQEFASFLACARGEIDAPRPDDVPRESDAAFLTRAGITLGLLA